MFDIAMLVRGGNDGEISCPVPHSRDLHLGQACPDVIDLIVTRRPRTHLNFDRVPSGHAH